MATKRLLVDAIHPEETRIVVTNGNRLEEFDFESATRRQLRGNIYLAKVTRVEPSLQAAFVEYGGNRHGFLAFSEIHPDYYQIPVADREALLRAEEEAEAEEAEDEEDAHATEASASTSAGAEESEAEEAESEESEDSEDEDPEDDQEPDAGSQREMLTAVEDPSVSEPAPAPAEAAADADPQATEPALESHTEEPAEGAPVAAADEDEHEDEHPADDTSHIEEAPTSHEPVESIGGGGDALEETRRKPSISRRNNYKIQEVIKRRQVMLVQVVKEERGNKGAALTTYLSLAGRYSVLMPNTARGGGISRKITNAADRKRLKDIVGDLEVPPGQGIILRTAGASRTKAEVKRDFEYLQRLWENVRTLTLESTAPCLVYEEGSLIKRTIRDLYNKDIDEVWVAGQDAYREAKDFMRMIMPSHAKNVQLYTDDQPIFSKYSVEAQLDSMFSPQVTLPSGGYIVINPTEALVSIDVNSGRSTREHNIEDTALQTNLEAADEVARQLRLRDLAGLIVIDFIDMVENRSNRAVERRLKDALKNDRARIQVGRISHFGLMEMSRQRIRFGVVESSTHKCPVCDGTGIVRSVESVALLVMRAVEDHVLRKPGQSINVKVPTDVALYILNTKRSTLNALEAKHDLSITIVADDHVGSSHYAIERGEARADRHTADTGTHVRVDTAAMVEIDDAAVEDEDDSEDTEAREGNGGENGGDRQGRRRRRRGRGRDRDERRPGDQHQSQPQQQFAGSGDEDSDDDAAEPGGQQQPQQAGEPRGEGDGERRRRRRGRRGGRRNRRPDENGETAVGANGDADAGTTEDEVTPAVQPAVAEDVAAAVLAQDAIAEIADAPVAAEAGTEAEAEAPKPRRARRIRKTDSPEASVAQTEGEATEVRPRSRRRKAAPPTEAEAAQSAEALNALTTGEAAAPPPVAEPTPEPVAETPAEEPRRPRKDLPDEGVIVTSTTAPEGEQKPKKGWWNRGFFGN